MKKIFIKNTEEEKYIIFINGEEIEKYLNLDDDSFKETYENILKKLKRTSKYKDKNLKEFENILVKSQALIKLDKEDDLIESITYYEKEDEARISYYSGEVERLHNTSEELEDEYDDEELDDNNEEIEEQLDDNDEEIDEYDDYDLEWEDSSEFDDEKSIYDEIVERLEDNYIVELDDKNIRLFEKLNILKVKEKKNLFENVRDSKIKNLVTKKRLISLAVATSLVATGFGISEIKNKHHSSVKEGPSIEDDNFNYDNNLNSNPLLQETSEIVIPTAVPTATPTVVPTIVPTATSAPISNNFSTQPEEIFYMSDFNLEGSDIALELYQDGNLPIKSWGVEGYDDYSTLEGYSYENMGDLANHIQNPTYNPTLESVGKIIYYEKFYGNQDDYYMIQHFNRYRNEIIWQAFYENDIDTARYYINEANKEMVRVIYDGNPIEVVNDNGEIQRITYSDLTPNAQTALKNIAWSMHTALTNDTFEYNGEIYDQNLVAENVFGIETQKTK